MDTFVELSLILALAAGISILMRLLKQPLIVGYILAGLLAGPYLLNLIHSTDTLGILSKLGVTALLFIVGLNLSPLVIREVGKASLITGLGQVLFTSLIGFPIARALGFDPVSSLYIAVALTFSSTIIILKLLIDKGDAEKLYGKVSIGFLLVQDIIAAIILLLIPTIAGAASETNPVSVAALTLLGAGALVAFLYWFGSKVLSRLSNFGAQSQELLFILSVAWGVGLAALFHTLNFSIEIGALVAGVTLSATPYAQEISSRMKPIRDLFLMLFFVLLGSQLILTDFRNLLFPAAVLSTFVLLGNPLIVFLLMNLLGFTRQTSFLAGLTVAQISEFSLVMVALGVAVGHVPQTTLSLVTLVGMVTIAGSTYMILGAGRLYSKISPFLSCLELRKTKTEPITREGAYNTLLFGYHRVGRDFVEAFQKLGRKFLVVDFNPETARVLQREGTPFKYGDVTDAGFLEELHLKEVGLIVSTVPDFEANLFLVDKVKAANPRAAVIVLSHNVAESRELYQRGATYVVMPHYLGAQHAVKLISEFNTDLGKYREEKEKHLRYLERPHGIA